MKNVFLFSLSIVFSTMLYSQTVHFKNKYGEAVVYVDGNNLRLKNQYGDALYFVDGNTVKYKNQYGDPMYFFDGFVEKWVVVCLSR